MASEELDRRCRFRIKGLANQGLAKSTQRLQLVSYLRSPQRSSGASSGE